MSPGSEQEISEQELTELALNAEPNPAVPRDAVPYFVHLAVTVPGTLPEWYMPTATARRGGRLRTVLVVSLVSTFLVLEALGLCSVFGHVVLG